MSNEAYFYTIKSFDNKPQCTSDRNQIVLPWADVKSLSVSNFHKKSISFHPRTKCQLMYDLENLYCRFFVQDHYIKAQILDYQGPVCYDSCVEFFIQPQGLKGYFNFEINCIGTLHLSHIIDPKRDENGFAEAYSVSKNEASNILILASLGKTAIIPEIEAPLDWSIEMTVPFVFFQKYIHGFKAPKKKDVWHGNLYKCGDKTSHPHWASWAPIGTELNFHVPDFFGNFHFD